MCRIAAYLGPPLALSELLYEPPHSLEVQSYRPREMVSGTVNVDGTGCVWWNQPDPRPLRYITERPPWSDPNLPSLARRLSGSPILATVRSATPGIASGPGAVLPFVQDDLAGSHNGYLGGFREATCAAMLARIPEHLLGSLETITDSALLFRLLVAAHEGDATLAAAIVEATGIAARVCAETEVPASLNLVAATSERIVGIRRAHGVEPNSLYVRETGAQRWLASEPLDEHRWDSVPADHVVTLDSGGIRWETVGPQDGRTAATDGSR